MKSCPEKLSCPCDGNPVGNFSSEAPDQDVFLGFSTGFIANNPNPGDTWDNSGGFNYCTSPTSQAEADLCADNGSTDNGVNGGGTGSGGTNNDSGNRGGATLYQSSEQTCSIACPDGNLFSYTLRAGAVTSPNPVLVDRIANSIACLRANQKLICISSISGMACLDESYEQVIQVGSTVPAPVTWHLESGALPPGLEVEFDLFNSRLINISGTPTTAGNYHFTLRADDADGNFMVKAFTISVLAISNTPTQATVGSAYSFQFAATGGTAPYTYSVPPGNLPDGLTMSDSGLITGTPTDTDLTTFTVTIEDATGNQCGKQFTMTPSPGGTPLRACKTLFFHYDITFGDQSLEPWSASVLSGSLPPGIILGVINIPGVFAEIFLQGHPTTVGNYPFTIRTTDMNGANTDYQFNMTIMALNSPDGFCTAGGTGISYQLSLDGAQGAVTYAVTAGSLPTGITLSSTGLLSGTSSDNGAVSFTITATDAASNSCAKQITIYGGSCSGTYGGYTESFDANHFVNTPTITVTNTLGTPITVYVSVTWSGVLAGGVQTSMLASQYTGGLELLFDDARGPGGSWSNETTEVAYVVPAGATRTFDIKTAFSDPLNTSHIWGTWKINCCPA